MPTLRPFFTFYGGKWRAAPHYPKPRYDTIIEPFAGSAGYSLRYPEREIILVEKDPVIAATWRYLINVDPEEILALPDIGPGQTVDDLGVSDDAKRLIGWWLNKGTTRPGRSPSSWMRGGTRPNSYWGAAIRDRIAYQVSHIRHWSVTLGDYSAAPNIAATWFIDPPYQNMGKHYRHGAHAMDFCDLGAWCDSRKGQAVVCEALGADWLPFRPWREIRASPARHGGKVSHEAIWTNDDAGAG